MAICAGTKNSATQPSVAADVSVRQCRHFRIPPRTPHLSLRGAKRRGNPVQALRRRKLRIVRFLASSKAHSFRCSSSPLTTASLGCERYFLPPVAADVSVRQCRHFRIPPRTPPSVIARSEATWQSCAGTKNSAMQPPVAADVSVRQYRHFRIPPRTPPSVIARSEATWQSRAGTLVKPPLVGHGHARAACRHSPICLSENRNKKDKPLSACLFVCRQIVRNQIARSTLLERRHLVQT